MNDFMVSPWVDEGSACDRGRDGPRARTVPAWWSCLQPARPPNIPHFSCRTRGITRASRGEMIASTRWRASSRGCEHHAAPGRPCGRLHQV